MYIVKPSLSFSVLLDRNRHPAAVRVPDRDGIRAAVHQLHGQLQGRPGLRLVFVTAHPTPRGRAGACSACSVACFERCCFPSTLFRRTYPLQPSRNVAPCCRSNSVVPVVFVFLFYSDLFWLSQVSTLVSAIVVSNSIGVLLASFCFDELILCVGRL